MATQALEKGWSLFKYSLRELFVLFHQLWCGKLISDSIVNLWGELRCSCAYSLAGFLFGQPCKIVTKATVWDCFVVLQQAVIFVDNAGSDVVLGILPLARELLRRGTKVWVLCSQHFFLCCFLPFFFASILLLTGFYSRPSSSVDVTSGNEVSIWSCSRFLKNKVEIYSRFNHFCWDFSSFEPVLLESS